MANPLRPMRTLVFLSALIVGTLSGVTPAAAQSAYAPASAATPGSAAQNFNLPKLGLAGGTALPLWKAEFMGTTIFREIQGADVVMNDPLIAQYVDYLGHRLSSVANGPGEPFHYFVIKVPEINAFALPGAYIAVFSRLILDTRNEDELAGVLAHETAHIVQRHAARQMADASYNDLINLGILLGGVVAAVAGVGPGAVIAAQGGVMQRMVNYTRADEMEADHVGIGILARADFNPDGMIRFFQYMQRNYALQGYNIPEFLSTHPLDLTRITQAQIRAKSMHVTPAPENPNYALMRARIRVLVSDDPAQTLDYFRAHEKTLTNPWYRAAAVYGIVLCLDRLQQSKRALELITPLAAAHPNNIALQLAKVQALLTAGQTEQGLAALATYDTLFGSDTAVTMAYAQTLLNNDRAQKALALLRPGMDDGSYRYNPEFYHLLARAANASGDTVTAYLAMAHYFEGRGQYQSAVIQLRLGLEMKNLTAQQRSTMETMKKKIKDEYKQAQKMGLVR